MQIEPIENPLIVPTSDGQRTTLALHDPKNFSPNDETKSTEEQTRLLLSWRAVLGEIGSGDLGAGQW